MVDMHMHTLYSDGNDSLSDVLKKCEQKNLEYIAITDHNTCREYDDNAWNEKLYSGNVIIGAEMNATLDNGKRIEFLAYNIQNPEIINEWSDKFGPLKDIIGRSHNV